MSDEQLNDLHLSRPSGVMQSTGPGSRVDIKPKVDEQPNRRPVLPPRHIRHERGIPIVGQHGLDGLPIGVKTGLKKRLNGLSCPIQVPQRPNLGAMMDELVQFMKHKSNPSTGGIRPSNSPHG